MEHMRIVVMSDSHQNRKMVNTVIEQQPEANLYVHLGDGIEEFKSVMNAHPEKEAWCVRGNCDYTCPEESLISSWVKDIKVLYLHGHEWNVKLGLDDLKNLAHRQDAKLVLFGHTHQPYYEYDDGLILLNPGSLGKQGVSSYPSYATIDIQGKNIVCNHIEIKRW